MTQTEYEQKKRECWETFLRLGGGEEEIGKKSAFDFAFDRSHALSRQEKDADTVIQGWVARDKNGDLFMYSTKPEWDRLTGMWYGERALITPSNDLFLDLTWDSDPEPVEIIIKRKKK